MVALWNKRYFEEKNGECAACLKYSVLIFGEKKYIKCNIWRVAVRPSYIQDARFLKVNGPDHDQQHCYHHAPTVKPEAANAVVELLMIGVRTPETC